MIKRGTLLIFILIQAAFLFSQEKYNEFDNETLNSYYYVKDLIFSNDMIIKEEFLTLIFESVEGELERMISDDMQVAFPSDIEINDLEQELSLINYNFEGDKKLPEVVSTLQGKELEEYNLKLLKARLIKSTIVEVSDAENKQRMFNNDLEIAIRKYAEGQFKIAYYLLNETLLTYNYVNMSDVMFFKAECLVKLGNVSEAVKTYKLITETQPESEYIKETYQRLFYLSYIEGEFEFITNNYKNYATLFTDDSLTIKSHLADRADYVAGLSAYRLASITIDDEIENQNELERLLTFTDSALANVTPAYENYGRALYIRANSLTILKEFEEAEALYNRILVEGYNDTDDFVGEGSYLKLGYLKFNEQFDSLSFSTSPFEYSTEGQISNQGNFNDVVRSSFEYFDQIDDDSEFYEDALVAKAWIYNRTGEYTKSDSILNFMITEMPQTSFIYEINTLKGLNKDLAGADGGEDFRIVLEAYRDFINSDEYTDERLEVLRVTEKLINLRELIYTNYATERNLDEYYSIKNELMILLANSSGFLKELEAKHPYLASIADEKYKKTVLNKIINDARKEISLLDQYQSDLIDLNARLSRASNLKEIVKISVLKDDIIEQKRKTGELVLYSGNKLTNMEREENNLQKWSDLSFIKYMLSNIGMEELDRLEQEINDLNRRSIELDEEIQILREENNQ